MLRMVGHLPGTEMLTAMIPLEISMAPALLSLVIGPLSNSVKKHRIQSFHPSAFPPARITWARSTCAHTLTQTSGTRGTDLLRSRLLSPELSPFAFCILT